MYKLLFILFIIKLHARINIFKVRNVFFDITLTLFFLITTARGQQLQNIEFISTEVKLRTLLHLIPKFISCSRGLLLQRASSLI